GVRVCANDNCSHFHGSSRWGTLATGRERRGKRLVFEFSWDTTTSINVLKSKIKIDFHLSNFAFCGTSDQFLIFCFLKEK
ncbi:TPA: hypothetical protein ACM35S_004741, partial [Escherichia coli]